MSVVPEGSINGLAEVVLRARDLPAMRRFYVEVLGLREHRRFGDDLLFLVIPGAIGRAQSVVLFTERWPSNLPGAAWAGWQPASSTLHHFALSLSLPALRAARGALAAAGIAATEREFAWAGWRSLMLADPEGNTVELVADDPSLREAAVPTPAELP